MRKQGLARGAAVAAFGLTVVAAAPASAAEGDLDVVNTETVQVYVNSDGGVESQRVYEQLTVTGTGETEIANPIEERGLRNLDGFSGYSVEDGVQNLDVDVDGVERLRTVSDYTGDLPLDISIEYRLDGEPIEPDDLVGADGELEVLYTVKNVTAQEQEVTFTDGDGGTITEEVEVPIPMVGSLTTVTPSNFTDVASDQANLAGDGKGGTKLSFTMTLFPPLGSDTATFGYTAQVSDAVVPGSSVSALPVNPLESPSFKSAGESYQSGSETGVELAEGATEIDANLLKLRDGSAELLAGLIQLRDGANELNAGLAGEAAPGANQLAEGAGDLRDGLGQLDAGAGELAAGAGTARDGGSQLAGGARELNDGLGQLDEGAGELSAGAKRLSGGTGDALSGSQKLESGLAAISDGLGQLSDVDGLPKALRGAKELKAGVDQIIARVGTTSQQDTLLGGLAALEEGLTEAETGSAQLVGGLQQLRGTSPTDGLNGAKAGVDQVQGGLAAAVAPNGSLDRLIGGLTSLRQYCDADEPACGPTIDQLVDAANTSKGDLTAADEGLKQVSAGLGSAIAALTNQLIPGAQKLNSGISDAKAGSSALLAGAQDLRGGLLQVQAGLDELVVGLTGAVGGVSQLSDGADQAYAGSGDLSDGLGQLDAGAGDLADGAGRLADGTGDAKDGSQRLAAGAGELSGGLDELAGGAGRLADGAGDASGGSQQLADGASELASGLGDAAVGSGRIAEGLDTAAGSAPQIVDGADRLSTEGMSQLIEAGEATAQDYGQLYATLEAGAVRAETEKMAYGAPEGAAGATAYTYELLGADGEGGRNTTRGLVAVALLALAGGVLLFRRRLV